MATDDLLPIFARLAGDAQSDEIQDELSAVQSWYSQLVPGADVRDPVLLSLFLLPIAARQAWYRRLIAVTRQYAMPDPTLLEAITDASLQTELQSAQLSLLGLTSPAASAAVGELDLYFSAESRSLAVPPGTQFTTGALTCATTQGWVIRSSSSAQGDSNEILLRQVDDQFVATVPVTMSTAGKAGNVAAGTVFSSSSSLSNLTEVTAATRFSGGSDAYSGQALLSAYLDGLIAQTLGTRDQIVAFLRQHTELGDVRQVGVIGYGDGEMHRDKTTFAPIGGAAADIYLAFGVYPAVRTVNLSGIRVESADLAQYDFTISVGRDVAPGFYRVVEVRESASGKLAELVSVDLGVDTTEISGQATAVLSDPRHGAFSRFQTATLRVRTQAESAAIGSSIAFDVVFEYQPGIDTAQRIVSERSTRFVGGDTLVRACIPLYLDISVRVEVIGSDTLPDELLLTSAILEEIYRLPCRSTLYQSDLIRAMAPYLRDSVAVSRIDYSGELILTSGESQVLSAQQDLVIPVDASQQLSSRTVSLVTDSSRIRFEVVQLVSVETP